MSTANPTPSNFQHPNLAYSERLGLCCEPATFEISGNARVQLGDRNFYGMSAEEGAADRLSSSLHFPEIFRRYENIQERRGGTCEWILHTGRENVLYDGGSIEEPSHTSSWDSFVDWLDGREPIYWISGKAGSGKSTLMKYLMDTLQRANGADEVSYLHLSFWFWEAGKELERTLDGCLRSLLWQLLENHSTRSLVCQTLNSQYQGSTWTRSRLVSSLKTCLSALQHAQIPVRIFLDGLDESGADAETILEFFTALPENNDALKVCISSRPEQVFVDAFLNYPMLQLQNLNHRDITMVIKDEFLSHPKVARLTYGEDAVASRLQTHLIFKAQGVFLWVKLAIRSLISGLRNWDPVDILEARLEGLPDELNGLYAFMLARNQGDMKHYRQAAALYFRLILHSQTSFSVLAFCFAINEDLRNRTLEPPFSSWSTSRLDHDINAEEVIVWICARTAGLLEIRSMPYYTEIRENRSVMCSQQLLCFDRFAVLAVDFIHRTARTYLLETSAGQDLLSACPLGADDIKRICFESRLIELFIIPGLNQDYPGIDGIWNDASHHCPAFWMPSESAIDQATSVWSELSRRGLLRSANVIPRTVPLSTDLAPFPSNKAGFIDACLVCCCFGWFRDARRLLETSQTSSNIEYLSLFLAFVVCSDYGHAPWSLRTAEMDALVNHLYASGANPTYEIHTLYGEKFSLAPLMLSSAYNLNWISPVYRSVTQQFRNGMPRSRPCISSCDFYTSKIHWPRYPHREDSLESDYHQWVMFGDFSMLDVLDFSNVGSYFGLEPSSSSSSSKIFVLGMVDTAFTEPATLVAVSDEDSERILLRIKDPQPVRHDAYHHLYADGSAMPYDGILQFSDPIPIEDDGKDLQHFLLDVWNRSRQFKTLIEALLHIGKTQDAVLKYVADKEADLRRFRSDAEVTAWKSWVLGPSSIAGRT